MISLAFVLWTHVPLHSTDEILNLRFGHSIGIPFYSIDHLKLWLFMFIDELKFMKILFASNCFWFVMRLHTYFLVQFRRTTCHVMSFGQFVRFPVASVDTSKRSYPKIESGSYKRLRKGFHRTSGCDHVQLDIRWRSHGELEINILNVSNTDQPKWASKG